MAAIPSLIPKTWQTPEIFRQRLGEDFGRQRAMIHDGHLLLVLHAPPQPDEDHRQGRLFWRDPSGAWTPKGLTHGTFAVDGLLDEYEKAISKIDEDEENATSANDYFDILQRLTPLVRSAQNLHMSIQEARHKLPEARELILLRDRAYTNERRADLLLANAKNTLDFTIARRAEEQAIHAMRQANAAHRLNVLAALFFPIATLATIFGMELNNGLDNWDAEFGPMPMLSILGVGLLLGVMLIAYVTRK